MLVIGARFRTLSAARAALRGVRASVPVRSGDVAVRPLGSTSYDLPEEHFLLAGRFDPADVGAVTAIVHSEGGRVIERRSDVPRSTAAPTGLNPAAGVNPAATATPGTVRHALRRRSRPTAPIAGARRGNGRFESGPRRPSPPLRVRTAQGPRLER